MADVVDAVAAAGTKPRAAEPAWYEDVRVVWAAPAQFFPAAHHTAAQRLNCVVRLALYAALAIYVLLGDASAFLVAALVIAAFTAAHHRTDADYEDESVECTRSSPDNPFANYLVGDPPSKQGACAYDAHADAVEANFARGLVKNLYDVYDKENGRRQFVTMPVTTALPDTVAFARYCYGGGGPTCKEDTAMCRGH